MKQSILHFLKIKAIHIYIYLQSDNNIKIHMAIFIKIHIEIHIAIHKEIHKEIHLEIII